MRFRKNLKVADKSQVDISTTAVVGAKGFACSSTCVSVSVCLCVCVIIWMNTSAEVKSVQFSNLENLQNGVFSP